MALVAQNGNEKTIIAITEESIAQYAHNPGDIIYDGFAGTFTLTNTSIKQRNLYQLVIL